MPVSRGMESTELSVCVGLTSFMPSVVFNRTGPDCETCPILPHRLPNPSMGQAFPGNFTIALPSWSTGSSQGCQAHGGLSSPGAERLMPTALRTTAEPPARSRLGSQLDPQGPQGPPGLAGGPRLCRSLT